MLFSNVNILQLQNCYSDLCVDIATVHCGNYCDRLNSFDLSFNSDQIVLNIKTHPGKFRINCFELSIST